MLLVYGRGATLAEIAAATGVPLGTVKSRLRLGVRRTREALAAAPDAAAA
jgi:DNA-directed RNA polymerase specialized sigma24 family protein